MANHIAGNKFESNRGVDVSTLGSAMRGSRRSGLRILSVTGVLAGVVWGIVPPWAAAQNEDSQRSTWPQWRGGNWSSISLEDASPAKLDLASGRQWRLELPGPAGSSPVVWGDQIFVTSVKGDGFALFSVGRDGQIQWERPLSGQNVPLRMDRGNFAAPSPLTDGQHVWATTSAGGLHCFDMAGQEKWQRDLNEAYGPFDIQFGMSSTPIWDNGRLYLQFIHGDMRTADPSQGLVVCLDAATGKEIWRHERRTEATHENKHAYTSPVIYRDNERAWLLTHGGDYLIGHSLEDGRELWRVGGLNSAENYNPYLRFVASPATQPGLIVVPSAKSGPVLGLRPENLEGDSTDKVAARWWRLERGTPDVATPVIDAERGLIYLCRENGVLLVLNSQTGEELSSERRFADKHRSTPVLVNGHLVITSRDGDVIVATAAPEPQIVATVSLGEETTASPAISQGQMFVRTYDALHAFRLQ